MSKTVSVLVVLASLLTTPIVFSQASPAQSGQLTVDRIYGRPSLNGRLAEQIAWSPDHKKVSFLEFSGTPKEGSISLASIDLVSGARSMLIPAEKVAALFPPKPERASTLSPPPGSPIGYSWAPNSTALLLYDAYSLIWFRLDTHTGHSLVRSEHELSDPEISPDGKFISFVRDHNLWLVTVADGKVRPLTTDGSEATRNGELDWTYSNELDTRTGYWWAPNSSAIAFLQLDERKVTQFPRLNFESFTGEAALQRYPVGGGDIPSVHVYVAPVFGGPLRLLDTGVSSNVYIPRVNWLPDSKRLAIQRLNRAQTTLDVLLANRSTGQSSILLEEKDPYWINLSHDLRFLKDGKSFLWSSERTGYRHLYLYGLTGKQLAQLTRGDWEVTRVASIDQAKGLVYFISTQKSPLERHLYRVSLDGSGLTRLSKSDGFHEVTFAPNAASYVDTCSNSAKPPRQDLYRSDGSQFAAIEENTVPELASYHLAPVEFMSILSHDDVSLNCFMLKPPNFDPTNKYPVLVYTYGGPREQIVRNAWAGDVFLWHQLLAEKGFIVFGLDNRGSAGRGHLFEEAIHYRLAAQELSDQRDGVAWLRRQTFVDPNRIGIWGWGYGGQIALHAMFEASEFFKVGFAVAPVSDWHYYAAAYTERYLGLPDSIHEESYQESSPLKNAPGLKGKLLIAHGDVDSDVHYSNTLALLDELIKAGKYAEVVTLPGRDDSIADPAARRILFTRATRFLVDNL
jgi:dipeptidyl-peptidase 4